MNKITEKLKSLETEQVKEIIRLAMTDTEKHGALILTESLNELETRIPTAEFVQFCDQL